jgi:hypothetical protein
MSRKKLYETTAPNALETPLLDVGIASDVDAPVHVSRLDEQQTGRAAAARQKAYDDRHKANIEAAIRATAAPKVATKFLYTTSETRAALGCGITRLYELINNGSLEARRLGHRTYITATSLEALVASLPRVVTPTMAKAQHARWSERRKRRVAPEGDPTSTS